jgi:hypothetical protein
MAGKMDVLIVPSTGHILAAATRGDPSGPAPDVAAFVGSGLLFRDPATGATQLTLAAQHLTVQTIDERDDVLLSARRFVLVDNLPELGDAPAIAPLTLNGSTIAVAIPAVAPEGGEVVWVYIEGGPQPIVQRVEVPEFVATGSEPLLLPPGTYRALVLAPGCESVVLERTVA